MPSTEIVWQPQPGPQKALIDCPLPEIFYGGARGGGKTDGILGKFAIKAERHGAAFNAVFFRREMPQQDDLIERAKEIYLPIGAEWFEQKKMFRFVAGGRVRFRPLEGTTDAEKYQGQNLSDAAVEEAGNYPDSAAIDRLWGALRSAAGVPAQLMLSANPGGPGHQWIKARYIDPAPMGMMLLTRKLPNGATHRYIYIPSRVTHNRVLLARDPDYVNRLYLVGGAALVKAWLEGDWNVISGAYFDCWTTERHVIQPFEIPPHWLRLGSLDWGSARPFAMQWWTVSDGSLLPDGRQYPAGAMILYREWYGCSEPNVGLKLTAEQLAEGIKQREAREPARFDGTPIIAYRVADPSCWKVDGGPSIAERMRNCGVLFRPADNNRINGWDQLRNRLIGDDDPMLYVFASCSDFIRTVPALQHDEARPEDLDTDGEDHDADSARYAAMSRPWTRNTPKEPNAFQKLPASWKAHLDRQRRLREEA